jgi:hypothetical protein
MSRLAVKVKEFEQPQEAEEKPSSAIIEFPASPANSPLNKSEETVNQLTVDYASTGYAEYERGSLLRIFRQEFRQYVEYMMSDSGGKLTLEEACKSASVRYDMKGAAELMEGLLSRPVESVSFAELSELWQCSSDEAERYFELVKQEAQREFRSGHMAAKVFEPVDWLRSVWQRAQFLAVRDSFIAEYEPEGGIEFALVDTMAICFFMQNYWAEVAVKRTRTDPRRESYEYTQWKGYKDEEAKARRYEHGYWDIPFVTEDRAVTASTNMLDQFSRLFQRTLRQLNNHRLAKLKAQKLKAEIQQLNKRK